MPKVAPDDVMDVYLDEIAKADTLFVCSDAPANYAGIAAVALADVALTPGDGNGDFTIANGDVSGRKVTIGAQNNIPIDETGDADHLVLADVANTRMIYITTCEEQPLTEGGTVSVPAFDIELADPT